MHFITILYHLPIGCIYLLYKIFNTLFFFGCGTSCLNKIQFGSCLHQNRGSLEAGSLSSSLQHLETTPKGIGDLRGEWPGLATSLSLLSSSCRWGHTQAQRWLKWNWHLGLLTSHLAFPHFTASLHSGFLPLFFSLEPTKALSLRGKTMVLSS